ncbi:MAG TPA: bifunctional molybdenum cofactor biosynthesis protein MoaC/MoaB [Fimbriimonas sp.]
MRDVSHKFDTLRTATAQATVRVSPSSIAAIREGRVPKGDPLPVAKVAGILAAKNTPLLIPFCHSVALDHVGVDFELGEDRIVVTASAKAVYKTGVEMEALTAAAVAALNLYDILKMIDDHLEIEAVTLLDKRGGKSDYKPSVERPLRAAVLVVSDSVSAGTAQDRSGVAIRERLLAEGMAVDEVRTVPDEPEKIRAFIEGASGVDLLVATGGTGIGPRDRTPEAVEPLLDRRLEGVEEAMRAYGQRRTPYAMMSRSLAGVRGSCVVLCLPGSTGGVVDCLNAVLPTLAHATGILRGGGHP